MDAREKRFNVLKDPDILTDWQKRFEISGQTNPQDAWNKILEKEVSAKDYRYLLSLLEKELVDVHIPVELHDLFEKVYRAHLRKEYISDASVPKASLLLFVGPSGSGKTSTVNPMPLSESFSAMTCCRKWIFIEKRRRCLPVNRFGKPLKRSTPRWPSKSCDEKR
jgi:hypothetical protein